MMWERLYQRLLKPNAFDEDSRRKELILNILLVSILGLTGLLFVVTLIQQLIKGAAYEGTSPLIQLTIVAVFSGLLSLSRHGYYKQIAYVFVGILFLLTAWPAAIWGIGLPQVILTFSLIVVMTGVVISSRTAFYMAAVIPVTLLLLLWAADEGLLHFNTEWTKTPASYGDAIIYGITLLVTAVVAWLSNREIDHSLARARQSEKELLEERNSLERKVKERTKALEKAHVEKMLDLQRFAEFGRLSSTLLHELANPLTSVSLDLQQLEGKKRSKAISRAREGIAHMEQYVEAARRQLRNQSEIKLFDVASEIERVTGLLEAKARAQQVQLRLRLVKNVSLKGDSIRFNHIMSNLLTNAIDAYDDVVMDKEKIVSVEMVQKGQMIEITVTDYGRGITEEQLPHLFEPFFTTKQSRGTGIGLAITKEAVEDAFQGTITAAYSKRQGTRFIVRLPLA
jgi:signal transduction histidine kinase